MTARASLLLLALMAAACHGAPPAANLPNGCLVRAALECASNPRAKILLLDLDSKTQHAVAFEDQGEKRVLIEYYGRLTVKRGDESWNWKNWNQFEAATGNVATPAVDIPAQIKRASEILTAAGIKTSRWPGSDGRGILYKATPISWACYSPEHGGMLLDQNLSRSLCLADEWLAAQTTN